MESRTNSRPSTISWFAVTLLALAALGVWSLVLYRRIVRGNDGEFIYSLDDAYIHMAMARQFCETGVWGLGGHFSSSSSSPLWTLFLAGIDVTVGMTEMTPLFLGFVFAAANVIVFSLVLRSGGCSTWMLLAGLLSLVFLGVTAPVTFTGLEHTLHATTSLAFAWVAAEALADDRKKQPWLAVILAPFVVASRLEGLFLTFLFCGGLLYQRRVGSAMLAGLTALTPIVTLGLVSVSNNNYFVPSSVLLKGTTQVGSIMGLARLFFKPGTEFVDTAYMVVVVVLAVLAWIVAYESIRNVRHRSLLFTLLFLGTTLLHALFARLDGNSRYDYYLVTMGLASIALCVSASPIQKNVAFWRRPSGWLTVAAIMLLGLTLAGRTLKSHIHTIGACRNIYEQQYQMAQFIKIYHPRAVVAVNDIGAVAYYSDVKIVDLWGLATIEAAKARRAGIYDSEFIETMCRDAGVELAVCYDSWIGDFGGTPESWIPVAYWRARQNFVLGDKIVTWYATDSSHADDLRRELLEFGATLPDSIDQLDPAPSTP